MSDDVVVVVDRPKVSRTAVHTAGRETQEEVGRSGRTVAPLDVTLKCLSQEILNEGIKWKQRMKYKGSNLILYE